MNIVKAVTLGVMFKAARWFNQRAMTLGNMSHPLGSIGRSLLNRTNINYAGQVNPDANSVIMACIGWIQRAFTDAPPMVRRWLPDQGEWEGIHQDDLLKLLEGPNGYYDGITLMYATLADFKLTGNAYWIKIRNQFGKVIQLWWAPESMMEPSGDKEKPNVFIGHYIYTPGGRSIDLRVEDVIHFRDGMDPENPRKGYNRIKTLYREIFTDDEAANMTAALLKNMGVPGVIIAPKAGQIGEEEANRIKSVYMAKTTGDHRGEPMVMPSDVTVERLGFSPEQMQLRAVRGVPEERITAVLGVNAAVVALGAGLATTKVGATLSEYREDAFEGTIIPMYRQIALTITRQLVGEFYDNLKYRLVFDVTQVRVLQEDELKRTERYQHLVDSGIIRVSEGRRALGFPVEPEHEIYHKPANVRLIPAGPLRVQTNPNPSGSLEAALMARLKEPDVDVAAALEAYEMLAGEQETAELG